MPYGIRHTKKTYLGIRGIKKSKNRLSLRGKKNAFLNAAKSQMSSVPEEISGDNMYTNEEESVMK